MVSFIQHALIKENTVEARLFQELLAARVLEKGNSLIVAPTALGKTIIAGLVTAQVLHKNPERKVLLLAPTKPLAVQHEKSFKQILKIPEEKIVLLTGSVKPEERNEIWRKASVISATPQTIENDLMRGELNLKEFSLVVFDEAHKGVKDYSYVFIAQQFMRQAAEPLILALTASPGGEEERIQDVCKNLFIKNIEIKTEKDFDVKPFTHEIQTSWEKVEVPTEFLEIKKLLQEFIREQLLFLKKIGYARGIFTNFQRQKDLLQLQVQLRKDLMTKARKNPAIYQGVSKIAALLKATHAITLLETQGILALQAYFEKMKSKESRQGAPKALKTVLKDERVQKAMQLTEKLKENGIVHPKLEKLAQILQNQFSQNPESRVIVFNHYRDSAKTLVKELEKMQGVKPLRFVGQAMKERDKGMSQKEQGIALQEFKEGKYNTLLATAVAEEGLDIPEVDLVVFFEAVPSEIRSIQRRGRTGRLSNGKCVILMAKGTRDEAFYWSSKAKEKKMHETLRELKASRMQDKIPLQKQSTLLKFAGEVKDKVLIFADHREQASKVVRKLHGMGALVKVKSLDVGDFILTDEIVVERKTVEDFLQSIIDGRLFQQLVRMATNFEKPLMLLEGNPSELFTARNIHKNAILGALTSITLNYRVPILFSANADETAEFLFVTAKREQLGKEKDIKLRIGRKGLTLREQQQFIIESLPLVGPSLARALLEQFGSVKKIFNASEKRLQKVEKIGEKKAREIRKAIETEWKKEEGN